MSGVGRRRIPEHVRLAEGLGPWVHRVFMLAELGLKRLGVLFQEESPAVRGLR